MSGNKDLADGDSVVLFTAKGCPACEAVKKEIKKQGLDNRIEIVDISIDPKGAEIATLLNIRAVPTFVAFRRTKNGEVIACVLNKDFKKISCSKLPEHLSK